MNTTPRETAADIAQAARIANTPTRWLAVCADCHYARQHDEIGTDSHKLDPASTTHRIIWQRSPFPKA